MRSSRVLGISCWLRCSRDSGDLWQMAAAPPFVCWGLVPMREADQSSWALVTHHSSYRFKTLLRIATHPFS
jgi:hypothetical protein